MRIALFLLAILSPQDPQAREKASAFTYVRPKGWDRQDMPNKAVTLLPPGDDAQHCSVILLPGQNGELNELVFHNQLWQAATRVNQVEGKTEKAYRGSWQYSGAKILTPQKESQWMILYTTKSGPHLEAALFAADREELIQTHRFAVERMLTGIIFPDARPAPPGGPEWTPAPVPAPDKDVKLAGAWIVARMESEFSADPKASGIQQKHRVKMVALFEGGVAAKVDAVRTGLNDSTYPAEGLATLSVAHPGPNDRRFGTWSEADGKITITWNQGRADHVERAGGNLKQADGTLWSALKSIDGTRLEKTFVRQVPFGPPGMLRLRKDGSFDADQVNETMGGKLVNPKFPEMGSGTYEFRKWSLILRFDTGFVQSIHVMFDMDDPSAAKKIFVSGYDFSLKE